MTAPPIKDVTGRPPVELAGATADSPFATGGDLFAQLSTHALLYRIPILVQGELVQAFRPYAEHLFLTPETGLPNLLESHHHRDVLSNAPDVGAIPSTDRAFYQTEAFALPCASGSAVPSWRFHCRFGHRDATNGNRMFVGLQSWEGTSPGGHGALGPDPVAVSPGGQFIGIMVGDGATSYSFAHSDGTTVVSTDLSVAVAIWTLVEDDFTAVMPVQMFDLFIAGVHGVDGFIWQVIDVNTGTIVGAGTATTNIPDNKLALFYRGVGAPQDADLGDLSHTQWKQGIELIPLESVYYQDFGFGPDGIDARGGTASPPTTGEGPPAGTLPWHEPFDDADYPTFVARYTAGGGRAVFPDPGPDITLTGGALEITGNASPLDLNFGPNTLAADVREYWQKIEFEIIGATYDRANDAVYSSIWNGAGTLETDQSTFLVSNPTHLQGIGLYNGTTSVSALSAFARALPVGTYTFIICSSEDDATTQRSELWINATAGATADAIITLTKTAGAGYGLIDFGMDGPLDPSITLRVTDVDTRAGTRASDPFGIL